MTILDPSSINFTYHNSRRTIWLNSSINSYLNGNRIPRPEININNTLFIKFVMFSKFHILFFKKFDLLPYFFMKCIPKNIIVKLSPSLQNTAFKKYFFLDSTLVFNFTKYLLRTIEIILWRFSCLSFSVWLSFHKLAA